MQFSPIAPVVLRQVVFLTLAGRHADAAGPFDAAAVLYPDELAAFAADLGQKLTFDETLGIAARSQTVYGRAT